MSSLPQNTLTTFSTTPDKLAKGDYLGSGCFGSVQSSIIPDVVVKTVEDFWYDGWTAWAFYCLNHQGEAYIPSIYAIRLDFNTGKLWALVEKLEEIGNASVARVQRDKHEAMSHKIGRAHV